MGTHQGAAKCVEFLPAQGLLVSGSWDRCVAGRAEGAAARRRQAARDAARALHACSSCHPPTTHPLAPPRAPRGSSLRLWDPRQGAGAAPAATVALPGKVYSMSASDSRLVVAMSGRHVDVFDLRT